MDHRLIVDTILWLARTGGPRQNLTECYGSWQTAYHRFRRWSEQGIWERVAPRPGIFLPVRAVLRTPGRSPFVLLIEGRQPHSAGQ